MDADKSRVQKYVSRFCSLLDELLEAFATDPDNYGVHRRLATRALFLACKLGLMPEPDWRGTELLGPEGWHCSDLSRNAHDQRWVQHQLQLRADREERIRRFQAEAKSLVEKGLPLPAASAPDRTNLAEDVKQFCEYLENIIEIYEIPYSNPEIHRFGRRANALALKIGLVCHDRALAQACGIARAEDKIPYVEQDWWNLRRFGKLRGDPVNHWKTCQKRANALLKMSELYPAPNSQPVASDLCSARPSIFLSHSHADSSFARRLADDLRAAGVRVWIDEAEIQIGDSLVEKIRDGIDAMDYLGVILSADSVESEWVRREVDIAVNQEIEGRKVKVLPILYRECNLPSFLKEKRYANFVDPENYGLALEALLRRLNNGKEKGTF